MTADIKTEAAKPWYWGVKWTLDLKQAIISAFVTNEHGRHLCQLPVAQEFWDDADNKARWLTTDDGRMAELIAAAPETAQERDLLKARVAELEGEKRAPVQGFSGGIPWSMHLRAYDAYCKKYREQPALIDLEGRNCRGGFGVGELDDFIPGWREELSELTALRTHNKRLEGALWRCSQALESKLRDPLHLNGWSAEEISETVAAHPAIAAARSALGGEHG